MLWPDAVLADWQRASTVTEGCAAATDDAVRSGAASTPTGGGVCIRVSILGGSAVVRPALMAVSVIPHRGIEILNSEIRV
jgi:hypothetical protein